MFEKLQTKLFIPKHLSAGLNILSIKNRYALITYAFILLELSFFIILAVSQENKTQDYLELKTTEAKSAYGTVHHSFYKISEIVADSMGKNPKIIALLNEADTADGERKDAIAQQIEQYLKKDFLNLKELYFQEFRFILPNDHSFLQLDRSELFGTAPRGREQTDTDLEAFHFQHALYNKEKVLISTVEFSLSSVIFTRELEKLLETQLHFVNVKEIASLLQDDHKVDLENSPQTQEYLFDPDTMAEIALQTRASKSFSMALDDDENVGMVTFLAAEGEKAQERGDYYVYFIDDPKLAVVVGKYSVVQLLGSLLMAGIFSLVLIRINRKKEIVNQVNKKTKELQESNQIIKERYELTLAGVGDGIWDWNLIDETIYFSKRWKEMLGFEEDEIVNVFEEWKKRVHPEDMQKALIDITANIAGKTERYENIHRLRHKDGHWVWILDRGKTIFDVDGNAVRMLGTHTDITERKALENKVSENEARLVEAQKTAHLGNWEWNLSNHKITWSDELYRILGEEPQSFEPSYKSPLSYLPLQERIRYKKSIRNILNNMEPEHVYEWKIIRKDGRHSYVSSVIKIIYNKKGEATQVNGTLLDITERKDAEEQLSLMNSMLVDSYKKQKVKTQEVTAAKKELEKSHSKMMEAKAEAEQASRSKSEFLANMSHEIRTPLNAINGFIGLLKNNETDTEKLSYLGIINNSSKSLLQIINDILDLSKIESGKLIIEKLDFDPRKELSGATELFKLKAVEKDIRLYIEGCAILPSTLHGDLLRLKQILSNLLSNAIKFTDNSGEVLCTFRYEEGRLCLNVKDNGIGIPADKQKMIFDSFTQADGSTVRKYGGTGLGLTVSVKLAKLLEGDLSVVSKEGVGSEFIFSAPFALSEDNDKPSEVCVEKSKALTGHTLLVEDNEANQMFIGIILRNAGLTYDTANNGMEAIEMFKTEKYKLILMDENMPKLNGIGATKEILQMEKEQGLEHTPIIALTANALVGDRQLFLDAGMDDYLAKPLEPAQLIEKIGELMGN
jgi:PAS domain S-box-containing protein